MISTIVEGLLGGLSAAFSYVGARNKVFSR